MLVHGVCSNSLMWAPVQRELALLGHRSFAVDLPGHGFDAQYPAAYQAPQDLDAWAAEPSKLAGITLQDNVDMVVDVVRRVAEHGPVVLASTDRLTRLRVGRIEDDADAAGAAARVSGLGCCQQVAQHCPGLGSAGCGGEGPDAHGFHATP